VPIIRRKTLSVNREDDALIDAGWRYPVWKERFAQKSLKRRCLTGKEWEGKHFPEFCIAPVFFAVSPESGIENVREPADGYPGPVD